MINNDITSKNGTVVSVAQWSFSADGTVVCLIKIKYVINYVSKSNIFKIHMILDDFESKRLRNLLKGAVKLFTGPKTANFKNIIRLEINEYDGKEEINSST